MAAMAAVSSSVFPSKAPVLPSPARFQTTFAKTSFEKEARQVVLNVYYKLRCESPNESYKAIVQRTSELTRVGYSTIFRWKKLVQSSPDGTSSVPSHKRKRKRSAPPTPSLLDSFDRGTLRLIVHDFFRRNKCPTLSKVLEVARDNDKFPKISRTTLWRALVDLGFTFVKRNRDSLLMERTDLLNPIELVWSQVKGSIAGANKTFKLAEVELLTPGALQQVTPDDWKAYARHVIDVENKMSEADCLSDAVIDSVVIHLGSDDDKSSDEDMDDSSDEDMGCESLSCSKLKGPSHVGAVSETFLDSEGCGHRDHDGRGGAEYLLLAEAAEAAPVATVAELRETSLPRLSKRTEAETRRLRGVFSYGATPSSALLFKNSALEIR
ncbi:hypothetical protein HPB47_021435 [Ixodes persulcatus]|uniref:Uncharacterized protein n=1 Tax=Ixodes persulcatus TaxID=34615 RepID=A0AC60QCJ1_IXOPE|nr:hypothetical protein HPB47_021435 [Ixodes persulcatus]